MSEKPSTPDLSDPSLVVQSRLDSIKTVTLEGEEWSARDLMALAGYDRWKNWDKAIERAYFSVKASGLDPNVHFRESAKSSQMPNGGVRKIGDYRVTRYGAYILFQNADGSKPEIAAAQAYFAIQTRRQELAAPAFDVSTLEGAKQLIAAATTALEAAERAQAQLDVQRPLVQQALTYQGGDNLTARQSFAREIISWAVAQGIEVRQADVFDFLARRLGLFVRGERADAGEATADAIRRGLAVTVKGTAYNGHNYGTGKLTAKGKAYAWDRIVRHLEQFGTLTEEVAA